MATAKFEFHGKNKQLVLEGSLGNSYIDDGDNLTPFLMEDSVTKTINIETNDASTSLDDDMFYIFKGESYNIPKKNDNESEKVDVTVSADDVVTAYADGSKPSDHLGGDPVSVEITFNSKDDEGSLLKFYGDSLGSTDHKNHDVFTVDDDTISFRLLAKDDAVIFDGKPSYEINGKTTEIPLSGDSNSEKVEIPNDGSFESMKVTSKVKPNPDYLEIQFNDTGVSGTTLYESGDLGSIPYRDNETFSTTDDKKTFYISVSKEGAEFGENPYYEIDGEKTEIPLKDNTETKKFTINNGASFSKVYIKGVTGEFVDNGSEGGEAVKGFNHIYIVNNAILNAISKERFEIRSDSTITTVIDAGENILSIIELPFKTPDEVIGDEKAVTLGHKTTNVKAKEMKTDLLTYDLGKIEVPETYGNAFDYINTEAKLHLPYAQTIDLDVGLVIGETISPQYIINLYTGETTINIHTSKNSIIHSENVKLGRDIPVLKGHENEFLYNSNDANNLNNELQIAFIEIARNTPYNSNRLKMEVEDYGKLKDFKGFISANEVELKTNATLQEKESIINLLTGGVFING